MHAVWSAPTAKIYHARSLVSTNSSDLSCTQSCQHQLFRMIMHAVLSAQTGKIYHARSLVSTNCSDLSCTQSGQHQQLRCIMRAVWSAPTQQLFSFITTDQARSLISTNSVALAYTHLISTNTAYLSGT